MIRFVNPATQAYQNATVSQLSDDNKFVASGSAKAYVADSCAWIADFLYKYPNNVTFNKHIAYVSFFSNKSIVYQECGNIPELYTNYDFFSSIVREKFSPSTEEFSKKQYSDTSSRRGSFDEIVYMNYSDQQKRIPNFSDDSYLTQQFSYNHNFWRAPGVCVSGYKVRLDNAMAVINDGSTDPLKLGKAVGYDRFYWSYEWDMFSFLRLDGLDVDMRDYRTDLRMPNTADTEIFFHVFSEDTISTSRDIRRMLDVKINIDNAKYSYHTDSVEWINYYNDSEHYSQLKYSPYYGFVNFYSDPYSGDTSRWESVHPLYENDSVVNRSVMFFPQIINDGVFEPAKLITNWGNSTSGRMSFYSGVHNGESSDQSRIVYNICSNMVTPHTGEPFYVPDPGQLSIGYVVFKKDSDGRYIYCGIDVETERNRRYSSVVMTEPYLVTEPMGRGEVVEYMFVDKAGLSVSYGQEKDFVLDPAMFLKLKMSKSMVSELDRELEKNDFNTDIIDTMVINEPRVNASKLSGSDGSFTYYDTFGLAGAPSLSIDGVFLSRQDDCVDNLVGNNIGDLAIVGQGVNKVFYIDSTGYATDSMYTDGAVVNGLGYVNKLKNGVVKEYLNAYCSNYNPTASPIPGATVPPAVEKVKFLTNGVGWYETATIRDGWRDVAISDDATIQIAVEKYGGIWKSVNGGTSWTEITVPIVHSNNHYSTCAISNDGKYMLAGGCSGDDGNTPDQLVMSSDSGVTWVSNDISTGVQTNFSFQRAANTITRSSGSFIDDGLTLDLPITIAVSSSTHNNVVIPSARIDSITATVITVNNTLGLMFQDQAEGISTTLTQMVQRWKGSAVSSTGKYMVACSNNSTNGGLYVSQDFGVTWKFKAGGNFYDVCMSNDGQFQFAVVRNSSRSSYRSVDWGVTWNAIDTVNRKYQCCSCSANGKYVLFGVANVTSGGVVTIPGSLRVSSDFGVTFVDATVVFPGMNSWMSVAMNATGQRQFAASLTGNTSGEQGNLYSSTDYGLNWVMTPGAPPNNWWGVDSSSSGLLIAAVGTNQSIIRTSDATIYGSGIVDSASRGEKFRPMLKLSGINGYIKILERCPDFSMSRTSDGKFEVVYHVEFPYCPGSYTERHQMDFSNGYKKTWLLKKLSYISAGSNQLGADGRYEDANNRYSPLADDAFCPHTLLTQYSRDGVLKTKREKDGGGLYNTVQNGSGLVEYPSSLLWEINKYELVSLTKPRQQSTTDYRRFGTYDIRVTASSSESINTKFSRDIKLLTLCDNRQWKYDTNKFVSYIDHENPTYICEMDVSALFKNFTDYQKDHGAIPDTKRWLYSQFTGFAWMSSSANSTVTDLAIGPVPFLEDIITEKTASFNRDELVSEDSVSDIVIEVWDNYSTIGLDGTTPIRGGNWRPLSPMSSDTEKVAGTVFSDNVYVAKGSLDIPYMASQNIYAANLGYMSASSEIWPEHVNYGNNDTDTINGKSNLVLLNTQSLRTYHIAYIKRSTFGGVAGYTAYIIYEPGLSGGSDIPVLDISNHDDGSVGPFAICSVKSAINKDISFQVNTSEVVQGGTEGKKVITKFIDLLFDGDSPSDTERYVDSNDKIFFRVRVVRKKDHPVTYIDKDSNGLQYVWTKYDVDNGLVNEHINNPWIKKVNGNYVYNTNFNWKEVNTLETVKKIGMTYFKTSSK